MIATPDGTRYNRFVHLDSSEDRIIYWLLSPNNKTPEELRDTHRIWKLLYYNDVDALNKPLPSYFDVVKLICNDDITQSDKRIFRFRNMEEGFTEQCTILKIYIDSIIPQNEYLSQVNYGIDVICHNKIIDINVDKNDESLIIDEVDGIPIRVETKSRITALTRCILALLNGADIAGVGQLQFNAGRFRYNQVMSGVWNNRNFEGTKIVLGALQSGLS